MAIVVLLVFGPHHHDHHKLIRRRPVKSLRNREKGKKEKEWPPPFIFVRFRLGEPKTLKWCFLIKNDQKCGNGRLLEKATANIWESIRIQSKVRRNRPSEGK